MIDFKPSTWTNNYKPPPLRDIRWRVFFLLFGFLVMGMTFLGFDRKPLHVFLLLATGAFLDVIFNGIFKKKKIFPLSALISCCSLALLLNWSYNYTNLWLPALICIGSKYLFTVKGKHFFNPSMFAIVFCILFTRESISLAPSYQWFGTAASAGMMIWFVITGALIMFVFKIKRNWLILSFLITFVLQTIYRADVMEHIIPWQTLFVGSITSPAFYLFTFFMITDPATSPKNPRAQILVGIAIGLFDLLYHLKLSYYTFFFAGITVAAIRYVYFLYKNLNTNIVFDRSKTIGMISRWAVIIALVFPTLSMVKYKENVHSSKIQEELTLEKIYAELSGLSGRKSDILSQTDERIQHVAKWIISVGDAVAVADVNTDGLPDLFLTQTLKSSQDKCKLHINKGDFQFEKIPIPDLEIYLKDPQKYGVPGFAFFFDRDNDGDQDLFVGFGFGPSRIFENRSQKDGAVIFEEIFIEGISDQHSICLSANALDFNQDGFLDILLCNTLLTHLPDYDSPTPLNIFDLPEAEYPGDRRMFRFMHESWHNANNGGKNYLYLGQANSTQYTRLDESISGLTETRWSLATGTADFNDDGKTDIYIANDFGRDDCYINMDGQKFVRQEGQFFGDLGLDTYKGMNVSIGDMDGDLREDVYVSNVHHAMQAEGSLLWMNKTQSGEQVFDFDEKASQYHALNTNRFGWGAAMGDLNLDGYPDILQANGMVDDIWDKIYEDRVDYWYYQAQIAKTGPEIHSYADTWADIRGCSIYENEADRIYLNQQGNGFVDISADIGFDHKKNTRGIALVDLDNDGDLDVLVTDQFGPPILYKNNVIKKQWLGLALEGNGLNTSKDAVGTKVFLEYDLNDNPVKQFKELRLVTGFMAMGDKRLLFGLGDTDERIENMRLKIVWHNGDTEEMSLTAWNNYIKIKQGYPLQ